MKRIELHPRVMAGKAIIQGTRLTAEHILNLHAYSEAVERITAEYADGVRRPGPRGRRRWLSVLLVAIVLLVGGTGRAREPSGFGGRRW